MEKEVYFTKYQIIVLTIVDIFITIILIATLLFKQEGFFDKLIMIITLILLYTLTLISFMFYKKKIPIYRIKEK